MQEPPHYSIIIAAFNEAASIADCVRAVAQACPPATEILVIDGGSDETGDILRTLSKELPQVRYHQNHNDRGKGHAIRTGIALASAPIHVQFDADLQFMPEDIMRLAKAVEQGECDVALGSRFTPESDKDAEAHPLRNLGNWMCSYYASLLFGQRMTDVLAGIKAWSADAAKIIDLHADDFSYEVEIPARALQRGLNVREFPIGTRARASGESKVSLLGSGTRILWHTTGFRCKR
jgi:glycosyltransferase involved in cell wall biosynthesis